MQYDRQSIIGVIHNLLCLRGPVLLRKHRIGLAAELEGYCHIFLKIVIILVDIGLARDIILNKFRYKEKIKCQTSKST